MKKLLALLAFLPILALAAPTATMTDAAKKDFLDGALPAAGTYKLFLVKAAATGGASTLIYTDTGLSSNEVATTGSYTNGTGISLTRGTTTIASNHACAQFTTPVTVTSATFTDAVSAVLVCTAGCTTTNRVIGFFCLDGAGGCAAPLTSTNGTVTINLPAAGLYCMN